jgi:hypothetical protein
MAVVLDFWELKFLTVGEKTFSPVMTLVFGSRTGKSCPGFIFTNSVFDRSTCRDGFCLQIGSKKVPITLILGKTRLKLPLNRSGFFGRN